MSTRQKLITVLMTTLLVVSLAAISNAKDRFCYDKYGTEIDIYSIEHLNDLLERGVIVKVVESDGYTFCYSGENINNRLIKSINPKGDVFYFNKEKDIIKTVFSKNEVSFCNEGSRNQRFCYDKNGKRVHTHTIEQLNTLLEKGVIVKIIESDGYIFFYNGDSNNNRMIKSIDKEGNIFFYNEKMELIKRINAKPATRLVMGCNPNNLSFHGKGDQSYGLDKNGKRIYTTEITHCYDKNGKEIYPKTITELEYFLSKEMVVKIVIAFWDTILFYHGDGENYKLTSIINPHPSMGYVCFFSEGLEKIIEIRMNGEIRMKNESRVDVINDNREVIFTTKRNMDGIIHKDGRITIQAD